MCIPHADEPEQWATALADLAARELPWAVLVEGTRIGRAVASAVAARNGWGLTGDAVALEISAEGRLVAWKPAFGGQLIAPIESCSAVQMATVRPGVLPRRAPRQAADPPVVSAPRPGPPRLATLQVVRDDASLAALLRADAIVGVGIGVDPQDYPLLEPLRLALGGAPLAATRKVTDRGWLPHSRQIGVTGHAIGPRLYVAVGISGKLNHLIGVRGAGVVLALNDDPSAPIFDHCDVGLVGDWHELAPALVEALAHRSLLMASAP